MAPSQPCALHATRSERHTRFAEVQSPQFFRACCVSSTLECGVVHHSKIGQPMSALGQKRAGDWAQPFGHVRNTPQSRRSFKLRLPPQRSAGLRRRGDRCNGMVLCPKAQAGNLASARPQLGALRSSRQLAATLAATLAAASKCEATAPLRWSRDHEQDSATRHISTCELAFADEMIA